MAESTHTNSAHGTATCYDVITLGETMLRFTPSGGVKLEQAREMQVHVGGSESNTAVGLARLGRRVAWLSRLPRTALGELVEGELRRYGVDTRHVVWSDSDRIGLYFLEPGSPPRSSSVIYDRRDSAMSRMSVSDFPSDLLVPGAARVFHTTGITLAISATARETAEHACRLAKAAGIAVSCDVNYRAKLWSPTDAAAGCDTVLSMADLIFIPERDVRNMYALWSELPSADVLKTFAARYPQAVCVMTCGRLGSRAQRGDEQFSHGIFASSEIGRLGGGDAFAAGFIDHWLRTSGKDIAGALRYGAAASAIKYSLPGDLPLFSRQEIDQVLAAGGASELSR